MSGHFKHYVHAGAIRTFKHKLLHVALARIANVLGLHSLCQLAPMLVHFECKDLGSSDGARNGN